MLKNGPDPQCDPIINAAIGTSLFNDLCSHRIASKLLQTYFCADMYPSLENYTKTSGCLIALAYSNSGKLFSSRPSLVVTIASACSRSWSNAEVVPSHTFTAEGVKACLFVINVVQPVWPQTDVSFVSFYRGFSHTLRRGQVKRFCLCSRFQKSLQKAWHQVCNWEALCTKEQLECLIALA